ncbi:hypothetical protein [Desertimonas flava]|uniref:hypothetical protein n=1 Tax=Desertimonas flava TaxID=2064846 RepID=UPI001968B889|nr:hypothetical protein [Desertimonas flava]
MNQVWSWLLTVVGVTGLIFAGRRLWWAWLIGLGAQGLWLAYAIATRQWGVIVSAAAYGATYTVNARRWWRERQAPASEEEQLIAQWLAVKDRAPIVMPPNVTSYSERGPNDRVSQSAGGYRPRQHSGPLPKPRDLGPADRLFVDDHARQRVLVRQLLAYAHEHDGPEPPAWCICRSHWSEAGEHSTGCEARYDAGVELIERAVAAYRYLNDASGPNWRFVPDWCICRSQYERTGAHVDDCLAKFKADVAQVRRSTDPQARKVHDTHFENPPAECRVCAAAQPDLDVPDFVRPKETP